MVGVWAGIIGAVMLPIYIVAFSLLEKDTFGVAKNKVALKRTNMLGAFGAVCLAVGVAIGFGISEYNKPDHDAPQYNSPYQEPADNGGDCPAGPRSC
jgi:hypothetical protein